MSSRTPGRSPWRPDPKWSPLIVMVALLSALGLLAAGIGSATAVAPPLTFTDVAASSGVALKTLNFGAPVVADFDADGDEDYFQIRHHEAPAKLMVNDGTGHFTERFPGLFYRSDRHDCETSDVNGDDRLDLYCAAGADFGYNRNKTNQLWLQQPTGSFVQVSDVWGVRDPTGRGRYVEFWDHDRDGDEDLYVGNAVGVFDADGNRLDSYNRFFVHEGTRFRDAPEVGLAEQSGSQCAEGGDVDNDGWDELLLCQWGDGRSVPRKPARFVIYRGSTNGTVQDITGLTPGLGAFQMDSAVADLDRDGLNDLLLLGRYSLTYRRGVGGGAFGPAVAVRSFSSAVTMSTGDADGDGWTDVYVVQGCRVPNEPDALLLNDGAVPGVGFHAPAIPQAPADQASGGTGCDSTFIDLYGTGVEGVIVENGCTSPNVAPYDKTTGVGMGPIQLIVGTEGATPTPTPTGSVVGEQESFERGQLGDPLAPATSIVDSLWPGSATGATFVYTDLPVHSGERAALATSNGSSVIHGAVDLGTWRSTVVVRAYVRWPLVGPAAASLQFLRVSDGSTPRAAVGVVRVGDGSQRYALWNGSTRVALSGSAVVGGSTSRLEWLVDLNTGRQELRVFQPAQLDSETATESMSGAYTGTAVSHVKLGLFSPPGTSGFALGFDDLAWQLGGWPGPAGTP